MVRCTKLVTDTAASGTGTATVAASTAAAAATSVIGAFLTNTETTRAGILALVLM